MKKNPNLLWITAIVLGGLFDFLFWKQSFGINFAIFAALCLIGGFFLLWINNQRPARGTFWLIPLILFFAAITFARTEPMTVFLGIVFTLFLMGVLANTFLGGRWLRYSMADYFFGFFKLMGSLIAQPISFNVELKREQAESGIPTKRLNLWPVLRGIVIAIPILAIFAALLASADTIFNNQLNAFLKLFFNLDTFPEYIFRLCYILFIAYILAGVFLHAALHSKDEKLLGEEKPLISQFLGFTETAIVLGSVTILFAAFVIIQFKYFFGGQSNISLAGFTYSEYARRGFGELIVVAFFSLLMILGLSMITRRENKVQRQAYSGLSSIIVVLVIVMLVSAYQRLALYEAAYGFSRLRTYTHVILIWIGLLFAAVVVLEIFRRERAFAFAALIASIGFAMSLSLLNVDAFIARQNINLATHGQKRLDTAYLVVLSQDEVPLLVDEFHSPSLPTSIHEAIGAILLCRHNATTQPSTMDWRSFTFSDWFAGKAMERALPKLINGYHWNSSTGQVHTPSNAVYDCY
jgi:hypothetical protein